jgi:chromosome segregation ATPase
MSATDSMLGLFGLATRRRLEKAVDRKDRWHGLVQKVFIPYYLKFQETAVGHMPDLPHRYSQDWEKYVQQQLDDFMELDLESVGDLLDAAGFGTEKWDRLQETGFPALERLLDQVVEEGEGLSGHANGNGVPRAAAPSAAAIDAAVSEDLEALTSRHPDLVREFARRLDPDSGTLRLTDEDLEGSQAYRRLVDELDEARHELRRFRRGGQRALERIGELEARLRGEQANGNGHPLPARDSLDDEREAAVLRKDLRARESTIAALRSHVEELEERLHNRPSPDQTLTERVAWLERELQSRDDQVVRQQMRIDKLEDELERPAEAPDESAQLRQLRTELKKAQHDLDDARAAATGALPTAGVAGEDEEGAASLPGGDDDAADVQQLRNDLKARQHTIDTLREEVERAQAQLDAAGGRGGEEDDETSDGNDIRQLRSDLKAREHTIETLREQLERAGAAVDTDAEEPDEEPAEDLQGQIQQLRKDLKARDHTIEALREQLSRLEEETGRLAEPVSSEDAQEAAGRPPTPAARGADDSSREQIEALQRDLRARDERIRSLRDQLQQFENELGEARERMLAEVKRLAELAAGDIELKPSEELESMEADQLLDYARNVAEDLDVRRQTLDEGLQGVESVKGSYEETRELFEKQQREMGEQLEQLRAEVETYRDQETFEEDADKEDEETLAGLRHTIGKQRQQLDLLATRVKQLVTTNKELNEANAKMYEKLEKSVNRLIPLRRQIEELEHVQDALQRYVRQKYERTFTLKNLQELR